MVNEQATSAGFFSYKLVDQPIARQIVAALRARNLSIWFDESDIDATGDIDLQLWPALLMSNYTIALITANAVEKRGYFGREMAIAEKIEKSSATGSVQWGTYRFPPNETVVTSFRRVIYLVWDDVEFSSDDIEGDFMVVKRSPTLSGTCDMVEANIRDALNLHNHQDVLFDFSRALSHTSLREVIAAVKEAEPFRSVIHEKIEWPCHVAQCYQDLIATKSAELPTPAIHSLTADRMQHCKTEFTRFRRLADAMAKDLRVKTLLQYTNDYAVCMRLMNQYGFPVADPKSRCGVCGYSGTILHGCVDAGGFTPADYNDNYYVVCEYCGYSWYFFNIDMTGNEWRVFDYATNTYVDHDEKTSVKIAATADTQQAAPTKKKPWYKLW